MLSTLPVGGGVLPNWKTYGAETVVQPVPALSEEEQYLQSSPYNFHPHLLDLSALTTPQSLLAQALTVTKSIRVDYATAPYSSAFNWDEVFDKLYSLVTAADFHWDTQRYYVVVFRSCVQQTTDLIELGKMDERSHAEANRSGGLLKYWFGVPDAEGRNLATCRVFFSMKLSCWLFILIRVC